MASDDGGNTANNTTINWIAKGIRSWHDNRVRKKHTVTEWQKNDTILCKNKKNGEEAAQIEKYLS